MSLESAFPSLAGDGYQHTSPRDVRYNCIAWAAESKSRWWWPDPQGQYYWPEGAPREVSISAFVEVFSRLGYSPCADEAYRPGFEKVVIYVKEDKPTHAARQLGPANWKSKLGPNVDISHPRPESLCGPEYGEVGVILSRPAEDA